MTQETMRAVDNFLFDLSTSVSLSMSMLRIIGMPDNIILALLTSSISSVLIAIITTALSILIVPVFQP
jgi:hypothetical protein